MPRKRAAEPEGRLVQVAVMAAIRNLLTYRVPAGLEVHAGQRVLVPLGTRRATGLVLEPVARPEPGIKIREILRALDPQPLLRTELLALGQWIADYYLAPPGEVFSAMLPLLSETRRVRLLELTEQGRQKLAELSANLLQEVRVSGEATFLRHVAERAPTPMESARRKFPEFFERALKSGWVTVSSVERERRRRKAYTVHLAGPVPERPRRLSPVARRILQALDEQGPADDHRALLRATRTSLADLRKLSRVGLIEISESPRSPGRTPPEEIPWPELTPTQEGVFRDLAGRLESGNPQAVLLHGVTASGKTEIYMRLIARCLEGGRGVIVLVPEIGLTPAVQAQFEARFGDQVAVLHSGLAATERHDEWWRVRRGEAGVVVGTRSAVFAPVADLGLIIVDEEHDASYKQEETPRYHARDVAVVRGRMSGALTVLGSATPSLESYSNARQGKYNLSTLEERVGGRPLAPVEIIDMREEFRKTQTQAPISRRLREEMEAQLNAGAQTMILLNRRGYSWFLLCRSCGQTQRCVNCSISLTYHRREHRLICHYCGYTASIPSRCPACGSEYLYYVGEGTEKMEQKLSEIFRGARVARLDRDVAMRREHFRRVLSDFHQGRIDILVGTQLIAKGHDFPGVTLVGVVSVDAGLALADFRAAERTFQLLTQAAGRAGRGDAPGRVLVQTFYPEHYAVRLAAEQNYQGFFSKEMRFRRMMHYPPARALANIVVQDSQLERAARVAKQIDGFFIGLNSASQGFKVLGPSPAPLAKIGGRYRIQFLVKADSRSHLHRTLRRLITFCDQHGIAPRSIVVDMDPVSVM